MSDKTAPKVFCGGPQPLGDAAAVMRMKLSADRLAQIKIINLFQPGNGDTICFPASGFSAKAAIVNGKECNFAEYLQSIKADVRLPLVANYCGATVNVSLKSINAPNGRVEFFAPVNSGVEYNLASPIEDYVSHFENRLKTVSPDNVLFLRIPMKADTCSNPYRTPFQSCRTVVGAKRRSESLIKGCPTAVKSSPPISGSFGAPSRGDAWTVHPSASSRRLFGRAVSGGNKRPNSSSGCRRSLRVTDSPARPNRRAWD
jgi:hypothetical protein